MPEVDYIHQDDAYCQYTVECRCYLLIANFQHCKNGILDEELPSFSAGARKMYRYNQARVFGYLSLDTSSRILQNAKKGDLPQPT